ncbi:MAG: ABC transporter permease [Alphaproteobacteria bacterium]
MHSFNTIGTFTLCKREIWRFAKVWNQTIIAPVITTLLFLAVLTLALGHEGRLIADMSYSAFVVPGLIMMAVVQNAFANTSSSLILSKIQGVIIDILMPPLTGGEITLALVAGGVVRGVAVGVVVMAVTYLFVPFEIQHVGYALFYMISASVMLALLGVAAGIWAQGFDQMASLTNYIVTPLAFLSGTFYSIHQLPEFWQQLCYYNPFFYMIDGFRYAMTGYSDGSIATGMAVLTIINVVLWSATVIMFNKGYRLKT